MTLPELATFLRGEGMSLTSATLKGAAVDSFTCERAGEVNNVTPVAKLVTEDEPEQSGLEAFMLRKERGRK
jgi:hypothetical protein